LSRTSVHSHSHQLFSSNVKQQVGHAPSSSRRVTRPSDGWPFVPREIEGAGKTGRRLTPMAPVRTRSTGQEPQVQPDEPSLPCAMVLTLISCSPWGPALLPPSPALVLSHHSQAWPQHREARTTRLHVRIDVVRPRDKATLQPDTSTASPPRVSW